MELDQETKNGISRILMDSLFEFGDEATLRKTEKEVTEYLDSETRPYEYNVKAELKEVNGRYSSALHVYSKSEGEKNFMDHEFVTVVTPANID